MATLTVYPDPDPETATVDGAAYRSIADSPGQSWAALRTGAGTAANDTTTDLTVNVGYYQGAATTFSRITRTITLFDTSALTANATISATVLSLYGTSKADQGSATTPNIDVYTSTPASNTALVAADYAQVGATSQTGSPITYANFSITGYNDFTFNATGRGNVSKTGVSKFGQRNANYDVAATAPSTAPGAGTAHHVSFYFADQAGTTNDPKLVVTYTIPTTSVNIPTLLLMGIG